MLKKLPIGLSDFGELVLNNCVYVDKTEFIYQMICENKYYFLSRPRRFGKSLLISTLQAIFTGKKELFKNYWIFKSDYNWQEHPIIRLDFSSIGHRTAEHLETNLAYKLDSIAQQYGLDSSRIVTIESKFDFIIEQLAQRRNVVLLVDEYDKPILDHIDDPQQAKAQRTLLKSFYEVIKGHDAHLKFVLLTGVSKFSKTSIFSGINNLLDITLSSTYANMLGYTHEELTHYFAPHIKSFAHSQQKSVNEIVGELEKRYDGYMFAPGEQKLFNPFSILTCLQEKMYGSYWFSTGTPTFVVHMLKNQEFSLANIYDPVMSTSDLDAFEPGQIKITSLLYQSGYLTIKNYESGTYTLDFPNYEVADGFNLLVATSFTGLTAAITKNYVKLIWQTFVHNNMQELEKVLQKFFNHMTYDAHVRNEYDIKIILFSVFRLIGIEVSPEVKTCRGVADLVVELPTHVYIFELKFNKTAKKALEQIQDKEYYDKYLDTEKQIVLVGLNFASKTKKVHVLSKNIELR